MANISYDFVDKQQRENTFKNSVGFFSLKNDGDDAIVRILHNSVKDFDMLSCHTLEIDGKYRKINCLREARDPVQKCPLCEAGLGKLQQKMFIHLLHYVKDENGNIVVVPKIWERSISYAKTLKGYIDEYGPLEHLVFKIRRQGAAGSMDTTYTILPQVSSIYSEQNYPIDKSGFEGYSVLGTLVMNKDYNDCVEFVRTGTFPQKDKSTETVNEQRADWGNQPQFTPATPMTTPAPMNIPTTPTNTTTAPQFEPYDYKVTPAPSNVGMPWENNNTGFQPPRRYN